MASQGPLSPGTAASDSTVGTFAWASTSNVTSSDNSRTYCGTGTISASVTTEYLKVTNFGFSIPSGATIDGISVAIERRDPLNRAYDSEVVLVKGGTIQATNKATGTYWPTSDTTATYGGAADLWSDSWTDSDINSSGFGVALSAVNSSLKDSAQPEVDHITITVYYTEAGTNEIQRLYFGSQASPVASGNAEAGVYYLGGLTPASYTGAINYNDNAAAVQAALEALSDIGSGNVSVSAETNGFTIEFVSGKAATNMGLLEVGSNSVKQKADTISVTTVQNGVADQAVTPSNSTTTSAVSPVDEVQQVSLGGATTGTFELWGNSTYATVSTLDQSGIQSACDSIWGSGNTSVSSDLGGGTFSVTFQSTYAGQNIAEMYVSNNTTDGSPIVSTTTNGVSGVSQVDTCTFGGLYATSGAMTFDGNNLPYNTNANTLLLSGASASGTPASGTITTTWSDFSSHTPHSVSGNTLQVDGQRQQVRVQCTDTPTEGQVSANFNSNTASWDQSSASPTGPTGWSLWSGAVNDWTFEATSNAASVTCTADDSATALRKDLAIEIVVVQEGSGGGGGGGTSGNLLLLGVG